MTKVAAPLVGCAMAILSFLALPSSAAPLAMVANPTVSPPVSVVVHDEGLVAAMYGYCSAFSPSDRCPFGTVEETPVGSIYAVLLRAETGDDCERGIVYFFHVEELLAATAELLPYSAGGVVSLRDYGPEGFAVGYGVSSSAATSCAANGSAGTDTYVYRWNGASLPEVTGAAPAAPKVIVGAEAPLALGVVTSTDPVSVCSFGSCQGYPPVSSPSYRFVVADTAAGPLARIVTSTVALRVVLPLSMSHLVGDWGASSKNAPLTPCAPSERSSGDQVVVCKMAPLVGGSASYVDVRGTVTGRPSAGAFVVQATASATLGGKASTASAQLTTVVDR